MSDSIKKWHEMQEEKAAKIYESPDGGKTIKERPFREPIVHPQTDLKKKAYKLLCEYDEEVIRIAMKIIDIGE